MRVGVFGLALFFGCDATPPPASRPTFTRAVAAPSPAPPPVPVTEQHDARGIGVTFQSDGRVIVSGTNRWGRPLDATYASGEYFRRAVAVIEQQVTPEQAAALREIAEEHSADP